MEMAPHPCTTRRFGPPADWVPEAHGECGTLWVADVLDAAGQPFMETMWRPSEVEIAALAAGGHIVLGVRGTVHPVVYMGTSSPPRHDGVKG
jgi:hypothetical protein